MENEEMGIEEILNISIRQEIERRMDLEFDRYIEDFKAKKGEIIAKTALDITKRFSMENMRESLIITIRKE